VNTQNGLNGGIETSVSLVRAVINNTIPLRQSDTASNYSRPAHLSGRLVLPFRFNGHFPGEPG